MKKLLLVTFLGISFFLVIYLFSQRDSDLSANEYTLIFVTYPGDRIDLYEYIDYSDSHHGKEIFYGREVDENGKLSVRLPGGKYTIWARCLEMSCQRGFNSPRSVTLNQDKIIKLKWNSEY